MTGPAFLTVAQVAEHLGCGVNSVHRAIARGDLAAFRDGRLVRISREALDDYIAAKTSRPNPGRHPGGGAGR